MFTEWKLKFLIIGMWILSIISLFISGIAWIWFPYERILMVKIFSTSGLVFIASTLLSKLINSTYEDEQ